MYGVEPYIGHCVRSLFMQTMRDIEFVFVDDCTPDASIEVLLQVLEEYPGRKEQVRIIRHEYNRGVAAARNTGMAAARGEYLLMVDGDDYFELGMAEEIYAEAKRTGADIVFTDFFDTYSNREYYVGAIRGCNNLIDIDAFLRNRQWCFAWNRMIRRRLITENNIACIEGINMWEDHILALQLYYFAERYAYLPKAFVHYVRYNPNSYMSAMSDASRQNRVDVVAFFEQFLRKHGIYERYRDALLQRMLITRFSLISKTSRKGRAQWVDVFAEETNSLICKEGELGFWPRVALWFAAHGMLPIFNAMNWVNARKKSFNRVDAHPIRK